MTAFSEWEARRRDFARFEQSLPDRVPHLLEKGSDKVAYDILKQLADGPMRPSALRKAVGIRSSIHFNRYYLSPLLERGIIARTDPDHPQSPQQRYCLT